MIEVSFTPKRHKMRDLIRPRNLNETAVRKMMPYRSIIKTGYVQVAAVVVVEYLFEMADQGR